MKTIFQSLIEAIKQIFGFAEKAAENKAAKIPFQEKAIREASDTKVIREEVKQDRILDRDLRKEPKILYYFDAIDEFNQSAQMKGNERPLYMGDKEALLQEINSDLAQILTRHERKQFRRLVKESDKSYFIIKIHPLTTHSPFVNKVIHLQSWQQ